MVPVGISRPAQPGVGNPRPEKMGTKTEGVRNEELCLPPLRPRSGACPVPVTLFSARVGVTSVIIESDIRREGAETGMGRQQDSSDLHADLLLIRKHRGFTADRLVNAGTLRRVLGGDTEPFADLRERFVSAINSLESDEPEMLLAAFGLTADEPSGPTDSAALDAAVGVGATLRQRRERYGRQIGRCADTVADREDAALEHLRVQLLTGWYPLSPLPRRVPEMHNGIIQESVRVLTVVNDRRWQETREEYHFIALFDEADYLTISSSYPGRPIVESEDFTVKTVRIGESFSHQFWHTTPMQHGKSYVLRFKLVPDETYGQPGILTEECRAFHERTLVASFEIIFIGEKPEIIWQYEGLSFFERPGTPTARNRLSCGDGSSVTAKFTDVYGGLFCGVGWRCEK